MVSAANGRARNVACGDEQACDDQGKGSPVSAACCPEIGRPSWITLSASAGTQTAWEGRRGVARELSVAACRMGEAEGSPWLTGEEGNDGTRRHHERACIVVHGGCHGSVHSAHQGVRLVEAPLLLPLSLYSAALASSHDHQRKQWQDRCEAHSPTPAVWRHESAARWREGRSARSFCGLRSRTGQPSRPPMLPFAAAAQLMRGAKKEDKKRARLKAGVRCRGHAWDHHASRG